MIFLWVFPLYNEKNETTCADFTFGCVVCYESLAAAGLNASSLSFGFWLPQWNSFNLQFFETFFIFPSVLGLINTRFKQFVQLESVIIKFKHKLQSVYALKWRVVGGGEGGFDSHLKTHENLKRGKFLKCLKMSKMTKMSKVLIHT